MRKSNPAVEVRELILFIENEYALFNQLESIRQNLERKFKKGIYDTDKAQKLWMYLVDAGVKLYNKQHGDGRASLKQDIFSLADRKEAAKELELQYRDDYAHNPIKRKTVKTKRKFSPAQLAAQKLFTQRAKAGTLKKGKRKKNPAKKSVRAPSKATGKAPSKRLVARRKANTKKGYFPNPKKKRDKKVKIGGHNKRAKRSIFGWAAFVKRGKLWSPIGISAGGENNKTCLIKHAQQIANDTGKQAAVVAMRKANYSLAMLKYPDGIASLDI